MPQTTTMVVPGNGIAAADHRPVAFEQLHDLQTGRGGLGRRTRTPDDRRVAGCGRHSDAMMNLMKNTMPLRLALIQVAFNDVDRQTTPRGLAIFVCILTGILHGLDGLIRRRYACHPQHGHAHRIDGGVGSRMALRSIREICTDPPTGSQVNPRLCSMPISAAFSNLSRRTSHHGTPVLPPPWNKPFTTSP